MAKKAQLSSGSKQVSSGKLGGAKLGGDSSKEPSPLMSLAGGSKKDYAKKPKSPSTEIGSSPFGMTGLTGET